MDYSLPPLFCEYCLANIRPLVSPLCTCCGEPFPGGEDHLCGQCLSNAPVYESCRSLFYYQPPLTELLVKLKFSGRTEVVPTLSSLVEKYGLLTGLPEIDIIVPVPLHIKRLRQRGFNQSILLARQLLPENKALLNVTALVRTKNTIPQSSLSGKERRANLKDSFALTSFEAVKNKKVLLIDDVYTTGSTVNACCRILRKAAPSEIHVLTVARSVSRSYATSTSILPPGQAGKSRG